MKKLTINSENGLHARPASLIVNACSDFKSDIYIIKGHAKADARSIMNLMALGVEKGDEIEIIAEGLDAKEAEETILKIIEDAL